MAYIRAAAEPDAPVDRLHDAIYATMNDDGQWQPLLERLCGDFTSRWAALARYDFRQCVGGVIHQIPANAPLRAIYAALPAVNPWFLSRNDYPPGRVLTGLDIIGFEEFIKTDFYREVLRPHGVFHRLIGVLARDMDQIFYVVLHRKKEHTGFDSADKKRLEALLPPLQHAFQVRLRSQEAKHLTEILSRVIQTHLPPLFVVDGDGHVLFSTAPHPAAHAGPQAATIFDHLRLSTRQDRDTLANAISRMAQPHGDVLDAPASAPAARALGLGPIQLSLFSLGHLHCATTGREKNLIAITVSDPGVDEMRAAHAFSQRFSLSPAQSRVCTLILSGLSPSRTAHALHLSENTVHSHLKQIFLKTNTHRQAELISLHARLS